MKKYVVGIGAANVDIYGKANIDIKIHYDHPSIINTSVGGVTRNILENLSLLKVKTYLLSAVGDDIYGDLILKKSKEANIDVSKVLKIKKQNSGLFLQIQDKNNDMHIALCDMSISKFINVDYLVKNDDLLKNASAIILDPSIEKEVFLYVLNNYDVPVFVDPISFLYAQKISKYVNKIYCLKPNVIELQALSKMKINNDEDLNKAASKILKKGCEHLFISLGSKGLAYFNKKGECIKRKFKKVKDIKNASGAGDSFFAAIIYSYINNLDISDTIDKALAAGIASLKSNQAINPELSIKLLNEIIKEYKK